MEFEQLLNIHIKLYEVEMNKHVENLENRIIIHDKDKINNPIIYNSYKEHFPKLKQLEFGSDAYKKYERDNFKEAHYLHAQNDHHFYSLNNTQTKPNLIDLLEAVTDIYVSNKQYSPNNLNVDNLLEVFKQKGILDLSLEEYLENTINTILGEKNEKQ